MKSVARILSGIAILSTVSCATTNREKRLLATGLGVVAGSAIGLSRPEEPKKNALMYGSLVGLGAAVASEFMFDDDRTNAHLKKETDRLRSENELLTKEADPKLQGEGTSLFQAPIPKDMRKLVTPGNWKRFKIDRWVQDEGNENQWVRQTELFEITPPGMSNR